MKTKKKDRLNKLLDEVVFRPLSKVKLDKHSEEDKEPELNEEEEDVQDDR